MVLKNNDVNLRLQVLTLTATHIICQKNRSKYNEIQKLECSVISGLLVYQIFDYVMTQIPKPCAGGSIPLGCTKKKPCRSMYLQGFF